MIPDDEPTGQPPDSMETINDDVVSEKTIKKNTTTFDIVNTTPPSTENGATSEGNKNEEKRSENKVITMKDPVVPVEANSTTTQRITEEATNTVIVKNKITTPVTFQHRPSKGSTNLNVLKAHQHIFSALQLIEPTLRIITFHNETIDTSDQFQSSALKYTSTFRDFYKDPKSSRVYVSHKIEFAIPLGNIKYGNRQQLPIIFDTLVTNNTYLSLNKVCTYKEYFIGFFTHIDPKVTLQDNFRN